MRIDRLVVLGFAAAAAGCGRPTPTSGPTRLRIDAPSVLSTVNGNSIHSSGFGSSVSAAPEGDLLLALTDRGPNYDVAEDTKAFPVPGYSPRVGWFRRAGSGLTKVRIVSLSNADGTPITGLPSPTEQGGTGEIAVALDGTRLPADSTGLDPEGIDALRDGTFWIADEYGPNLVHFDSTGRTLERINPRTTGRALPAVFAKRRPNRGMEGLTGTPDGATLVGLMQSPLDNPKAAGRASIHARILVFEPATGRSRQYLYPLDSAAFFTSDIVALGAQSYLVIEHDALPVGPNPGSTQKKIFRIDLAGATDVSDSSNGATGLLVGGKTVEQLSPAELAAANIRPVTKTLVADLLALGYPHDKPEGLVVLGPSEIGVINDDDFGITDGPTGKPVPKILPTTNTLDASELWLVRLATPLKP